MPDFYITDTKVNLEFVVPNETKYVEFSVCPRISNISIKSWIFHKFVTGSSERWSDLRPGLCACSVQNEKSMKSCRSDVGNETIRRLKLRTEPFRNDPSFAIDRDDKNKRNAGASVKEDTSAVSESLRLFRKYFLSNLRNCYLKCRFRTDNIPHTLELSQCAQLHRPFE